MLVTKIIGTGTYKSGPNEGKPFIRVTYKGKGITLSATENMVKECQNKSYVQLKVLTNKDLYPTEGGDSSQMNKEGLPIYSKGEKITVEEYWNRRKTVDNTVEYRDLVNLAGFLSNEEEKLLAQMAVQQMKFA